MQDPRSMQRDEFATPKTHKRKVAYRPLASSQIKAETELLRKEVPHTSGKNQKVPKITFKSEPHLPAPQSDRVTPDSMPESGPADEYRVLRRKYLLLEEENFDLDRQLSRAEEEATVLEDEKSALLDQLVVLEGLVDPSQMQPQRRI
ncbi:uncharacterized protein LOC102719552 [Oryza brachyantha]|nr:uncharacterized protein LOC102719552 [Oryza brachyantha]